VGEVRHYVRTSADILRSVDTFCSYYELMRRFVGAGEIKSSVDRGAFVRPHDVLGGTPHDWVDARSNSFAYGPEAGDYEIRQAIADFDNERFNAAYTMDNVTIVPGAWSGVGFVLEELFQLNRGQSAKGRLLVIGPTHYQMFHRAINVLGIDVCGMDFVISGTDHIPASVDDIQQMMTMRPKVIFVTNPNNPDGLYFPTDLLRTLVDACVQEKVYLVIDEIQDFLPIEGVKGLEYSSWIQSPWVIRIDSFSKKRALAEYRVGWVIADPAILGNRVRGVIGRVSGLMGNAPRAANTAIIELIKDFRRSIRTGEDSFAPVWDALAAKERYVLDRLRVLPAATILRREAAINVTVAFPSYDSDLQLAEALMRRGTLIMPCAGYGYNSQDTVMRVTFAERAEKLAHAMDALENTITANSWN
jgi:aspartate/methionine/tyrosine aminotransferase